MLAPTLCTAWLCHGPAPVSAAQACETLAAALLKEVGTCVLLTPANPSIPN